MNHSIIPRKCSENEGLLKLDKTKKHYSSTSPGPPHLLRSNMSIERAEPATPTEVTKREALTTALTTCPPVPPFTTGLCLLILAGLIYGTLWGLTGKAAVPGGPIFGLFAVAVLSYVGGNLLRLLKLPTLVGMMVTGFILRNVPHINVAKDIPETWGGNIRNMALILILLRAGLEVDSDILKKNKLTCTLLIFLPFIAEISMAGVAAHFLLYMPWLWAFLMGAMLSAVSPAVVLPVMLKLQKKGVGTNSCVPTMVIAVAGIDDVLSLTAFEVLVGITFSTGSIGWTIAQGPVEVLVGIVYGCILGFIIWYIPNHKQKSVFTFRFMLLVFGGTFILFGSHAVEWGAAGALGCITLPFVAAYQWKRQDTWDEENDPVGDALAFVWRIIEPFLFGLIGSEIRIEYLQPQTVGLCLAIMFSGIALRMIAAMLSSWISGLNLKEQIFITFAGLPKATVQAAIGPTALIHARNLHLGPEYEEFGIQILTGAVLAILITAPLGALTIAFLAPRLLEKDENFQNEKSKREAKETTAIPMYDNCNSFNYGSKEENFLNTLPSGSGERTNSIFAVAKL